ncbi:MAG: glucosidase [Archangiaceae bacterium]|nr:glucosidase [Archangiaceae bacterium]
MPVDDPESQRLEDDSRRNSNWKRWGPYLSERQWGTVREDYSSKGDVWEYFPHDHARSRAYRWGEDGLLGLSDRQGRLCFALALWNEKDPILKERLFGLTNHEGNHGEDVKEAYFYLDATPTSSYLKALYKYPQAPYPYARLLDENRARGYGKPEYELEHTGVFDGQRYFDVLAEYAKGDPNDLCIRLTLSNRGPEAAPLHVLPMLWFRNTWSWGRDSEGYGVKPLLQRAGDGEVRVVHEELPEMKWLLDPSQPSTLLFTENESNTERLWGRPNSTPYVKDAFHRCVVNGQRDAVSPDGAGTRAAAHYALSLPARGSITLKLRLTAGAAGDFDAIFEQRRAEADAFYARRIPQALSAPEQQISRQAYAGLLWSKQYYHYVVDHWLDGDPGHPPPAPGLRGARNRDWKHLYNRDVISMPDKWEYPWYAAWDLAFHMVPMAAIDPSFAKEQLLLFLREWYMHPNGQLPAYEFAFGDVNPPVHAWAAWRVYRITQGTLGTDKRWLARVFQKLLLNFTWWVNRKDDEGNNLFSGGFLGLDNIGIFDRSKPLPTGGRLKQADGTAWMAFYASTMLGIALELAEDDPSYEDMASKFFEHFVHIVDAMNTLGGNGLWSEADGFYYDQLDTGTGAALPLQTRSMVGIIPLFAAHVLDTERVDKLAGFKKRLDWFVKNRADLARHVAFVAKGEGHGLQLLAVPSRERLQRVLRYVLDEREFLSPHGVRALSKVHAEKPYLFRAGGTEWRVDYVPGEGDSGAFGGNSNWRGPVWFPVNYLLIEALERYDKFYGDTLKVECPTGSGRMMRLHEVATELSRRLAALFTPDAAGRRPCHGDDARFATDPHWRELVLFHEYFHGETGRGLGASHQTGWTALVTRCLEILSLTPPGGSAPR